MSREPRTLQSLLGCQEYGWTFTRHCCSSSRISFQRFSILTMTSSSCKARARERNPICQEHVKTVMGFYREDRNIDLSRFESTAIHLVHEQFWSHALSNGEQSPSEFRQPSMQSTSTITPPLHFAIDCTHLQAQSAI